ncbi:MAG: hypothetical protein ACYCX8_10450 [Acidimicrobiales bacterium]
MTSEDSDRLGRRAVFGAPSKPSPGGRGLGERVDRRNAPREDGVRPTVHPGRPFHPGRPVHSTGKHALYSGADPGAADPGAAGPGSPAGSDAPAGPGWFVVRCSSCHTATRVGLLGLVGLVFPLGVWLPGRRYDHWMACPSCGRRTWVGITLAR